MRSNHWLRVEVDWPLESLVWFWLVYSMISHIHAWNMERGWFIEREIWFSPIYGQVVHGSPSPGWKFHILIIGIFYYDLWAYSLIMMVILWSCFYSLYVDYFLVMWCIFFMDINMFDKYMNAWWMLGLKNVIVAIVRGYYTFLVNLR